MKPSPEERLDRRSLAAYIELLIERDAAMVAPPKKTKST
jgi:hypothetical protein